MATTATTAGVATTATTAGIRVHEPTAGRTTAATNSFTLSEPTDPSTTTTRTTPLEGQVAAERQHVIADVKETQSAQYNAVDNLSHTLENTAAATEGMFARDLPAGEVGAERQADPLGGGGVVGGLGSTSGGTIVVPASGQQGIAGLGNATLVQTVTVTDGATTVLPAQ